MSVPAPAPALVPSAELLAATLIRVRSGQIVLVPAGRVVGEGSPHDRALTLREAMDYRAHTVPLVALDAIACFDPTARAEARQPFGAFELVDLVRSLECRLEPEGRDGRMLCVQARQVPLDLRVLELALPDAPAVSGALAA